MPALRKLAAFILIGLLAFNWFGYRMLIEYRESKGDNTFQAKLDRQDYDPTDLVEVKVPLNIPYITDSKDFEDFYGETTINGCHYRFVKRKLVNNELVLLCIPDKEKDRLQKVETEIFKQVNDSPSSEKKSKLPVKIAKGFTSEFTCTEAASLDNLNINASDQYPLLQQSYTSVNLPTPAQPPNS
jgi:hypothetical protein